MLLMISNVLPQNLKQMLQISEEASCPTLAVMTGIMTRHNAVMTGFNVFEKSYSKLFYIDF